MTASVEPRQAGDSSTAESAEALLEVDELVMTYAVKGGTKVSAIDNVSFSLRQGEALGIVGESGCGKTSVALSLMRLLPENAVVERGEIRLNGTNILDLDDSAMRSVRWADISMVFQGAMNSWNPVYTVGAQIKEAMDVHWPTRPSTSEANAAIGELFELVGLSPAMVNRYPHEFSGGMKQRAVIAMALSCDPQLIIADEPTTALDVIVQDQILKELKRIRDEMNMSIIYISHDIAVIAEVTDKIAVMYAGRIVEYGPTAEVFARPRHPYTWLILSSTPSITGPRRKLAPLQGEPPDLSDPPAGCRFHPRCPFAIEQCATDEPPLEVVNGETHTIACWNPGEVPESLYEMDRET